MTFSTKRIFSTHFLRSRLRGKSRDGFTLVELLITIVIAAILVAIAAPSFQSMNRNMAVRGAADELVSDIQFARSEAARTNQTVLLLLKDRTWQVFIDSNRNHALDNNEVLLREGSYSGLINVQNTESWLEFAPTGMTAFNTLAGTRQFPATICLETDNAPLAQRQILFPTRASSPVIQAGCQ